MEPRNPSDVIPEGCAQVPDESNAAWVIALVIDPSVQASDRDHPETALVGDAAGAFLIASRSPRGVGKDCEITHDDGYSIGPGLPGCACGTRIQDSLQSEMKRRGETSGPAGLRVGSGMGDAGIRARE